LYIGQNAGLGVASRHSDADSLPTLFWLGTDSIIEAVEAWRRTRKLLIVTLCLGTGVLCSSFSGRIRCKGWVFELNLLCWRDALRKLLLFISLLTCGIAGAVPLAAQSAPTQTQGLKVSVTPLEGSNAGVDNMLSAKLISHLVKRGVSVTESEVDADVVLTGSGLIGTSLSENGNVRYHLQAGMRLVDKEGAVLWADDVSSGRFAQSASSSFADNVAKSVAQALSQRMPKNRQHHRTAPNLRVFGNAAP
jgi:hypothetical protein